MPTEQESKEAFIGLEYIKKLIKDKNSAPLKIGESFYMAEEGDWFGKNGLERNDFIGDLQEKQKTIYAYEGLYKSFCVVGEKTTDDLSSVDCSRLMKLKPYLFRSPKNELPEMLVTKEVFDEWVEKAKILSTSDFTIEFNQAFKLTKEDHECQWEKKDYWQCPKCGAKTWADPNLNNHHCEDFKSSGD